MSDTSQALKIFAGSVPGGPQRPILSGPMLSAPPTLEPARPSRPAVRQPQNASPRSAIAVPARVAGSLDPDLEHAMLSALDAAPAPGEPIEQAFRNKESALRDLLSRIPTKQRRALEDRLRVASASDDLATKFNRLSSERRERLLQFLENSRRQSTPSPRWK